MSIALGENSYGNSRIRLLRVVRQQGRHDVKEMTVGIRFEGDFEEAHAKGDNRKILPADTMKNTAYVLARQYPVEAIEEFCLHLIEHFLTYNPQVSHVHVDVAETLWSRVPHGGKPHANTFEQAGSQKRIAVVDGTREETTVRAGIDDLVLLKTSKSTFEKFLRDPYTTLKDDGDLILSTAVQARWRYEGSDIEFGPVWHGVRQALLETFAEHESRSLQHTLYAMGQAVLNNFDSIAEIQLKLRDRHYGLVDLEPFGMDNPAEVFSAPADEPRVVMEATLRKG
ncbi:MAG TPA: urate oxidase [Candidatus Limnocylindrales bacterium]|nr:urate oxidase [Candidatus Limnocylindrales bacterium]